MAMLKRITCAIVSILIVSMVCIPAAHADDAQGSITFNVQPSPDSNSVQASPRMKARDGGITDGGAEVLGKCGVQGKYETSNVVLPEENKGYISATITEGFYVLDYDTCKPIQGVHVIDSALNYPEGTTDGNGYVEYIKSYFSVGSADFGNSYVYGVVMPDGYGPVCSNAPAWTASYGTMCNENTLNTEPYWGHPVRCKVRKQLGIVKDCATTLSGNVVISNGHVQAFLLKKIPPKTALLSSFPITGKYTLPIVISLVLIAGITIIFIHRYGRKYNG